MKEVDLEKLKAQLPERGFDHALVNNAWFQIPYTPGKARSLWNLLLASCDAEVDDFATVYRIAEESKDLAHLCGLHDFRWKKTRWHELRMFLSFVWFDKNIVSLKVGLKDYIEFLCENSRVVWGNSTKPLGLLDGPLIGSDTDYDLDGINLRLPWRTAEWYANRIARKRASMPVWEPLTEFYPYIAKSPTEEHELLLAVDRIVGRALAPEWRGDFCQDLIVSILSGDLEVRNLHDEMPNYLRRFKYEMPNKYKEISIDALIFSEEGGRGRTLAECLIAKPEDEMADEELFMRPLTSRYGQAISDCQTVSDYAERLQSAWEANRLIESERKSYSRFDKPSEESYRGDPEYNHYRRKYQVVNKRVCTQEYEPEQFGGAWSPETALPEEARDEI